jgi:hypothetical protein
MLLYRSVTLQYLEPTYHSRLPAAAEYLFDWGGNFYVLLGNKLLPITLWLIVGLPHLVRLEKHQGKPRA